MKLIISTCGTSLLTNIAKKINSNLAGKIYKYANKKELSDIPEQDKKEILSLITQTEQYALNSNFQKITELSAELNAIVKYYQNDFLNHQQDLHYLITTDTYLGETAAGIIEKWLKKNGIEQVVVYRQPHLQTKDIEYFHSGISKLVKFLIFELTEKEKYEKTVLNLTGGFKSTIAVLQSIASFIADETIYVFETSNQLLVLPKLPIELNIQTLFYKNGKIDMELITILRRVSAGLELTESQKEKCKNNMLFSAVNIDGETLIELSAFGQVIWKIAREKIYKEQILQPPNKKIKYTETFKESVKSLAPDKKLILNERIDDLAIYLEKNQNLDRLDFKPLKGNPKPPSTHEFDAWAHEDAKRVFCHYEGDKCILDRLDKALH